MASFPGGFKQKQIGIVFIDVGY